MRDKAELELLDRVAGELKFPSASRIIVACPYPKPRIWLTYPYLYHGSQPTTQLALQLLIGLIHRLAASHQHSSEILDILCAGEGAGVPPEAAYRHQAEVPAPKLVRATPHKALRNPINRHRSGW